MTDRLRQKSTKVTDEERLEALPEIKREIRRTDPNLSAQEVERRALSAVGLPTGDLDDDPGGGRPRATARAVGRRAKMITSSGARKVIFGVMGLSLTIGLFRDIQSGRAATTDVIPRRLIGTFIASLLLMVLAGPAPRVARGLAFLVGFTVVAFNTETIQRITGAAFDNEGETNEIEVVSTNENLPPEIIQGRPS